VKFYGKNDEKIRKQKTKCKFYCKNKKYKIYLKISTQSSFTRN
jgi:hypothetical protein